MAVFTQHPSLSAEDHAEKRKMIVRDSVGLALLLVITIGLSIGTYFFVGSFTRHRAVLAERWLADGERYMRAGNPVEAVGALRSALVYAPDDRNTQMKMAMALAAAGQDLEAESYFKSILMRQPGDGMVHLQLARLAARHGRVADAVNEYQLALDGTWHGNGYLERLSVRLELAGYFIYLKDYNRAQSELRTASGNAPDDPSKQIQIASMMERAQDPADALAIYKAQMKRKDAPFAAFVGAGRTAYELGRIATARDAFSRATEQHGFRKQTKEERKEVLRKLGDSDRILVLYPDPDLSVGVRAERVRVASVIARSRVASCLSKSSENAEMLTLQKQWKPLSKKLVTWRLARDPQLEQTTMNLVYHTEQQAVGACGVPSGDDALLLKISRDPQAVMR